MAQGIAKGKKPVASTGDDAFVTSINRLATWGAENTRTLLVGVAAIALAVIGVLYYVNFQATVRERAAADLAALRLSAASAEELAPQLEGYIERFDGTASADEARLILARVLMDADRTGEAIAVAGAVGQPRNRPVGFAAAQLLATAQEASGDAEAALMTLRALGDDARFPFQRRQAQASAARILVGLGQLDEAAVIYGAIADEAEDEDPAEAGVYRLRLGEINARRASTGS
ncbi:MAG: tetratricopeptide repeat protein [Gemmatimonadetes bacterium]|nr:tetratricopeptide repeat protein [Gemmatimonadota bacterium]